MALSFFIKGLIFGFSIAMPVGPIGVLCIRRSLAHGWRAGMLTGTGAATADALYGCIAGFGLAGLSSLLVGQRVWIQLLGGLFLCYLGLRIVLTTNDPEPTGEASVQGARGYFSALVLTLTNPMTILSFTAVFAGMGLGGIGTDRWDAAWLVAGVFSGSMVWWVILAAASSIFNTRLRPAAMGWINRISGTILVGFGLVAIVAGFN